MAVQPEDLVEQLLAEAVHHRHHDDQRRDAEHDAEEREARDDRNESLTPPRAQVAQREHPFEAREGPGPGLVAHQSPSTSGISSDSGGFRPPKTAKTHTG